MPGSNCLHDTHGRRIEYARISLTDRCNFRCLYCMPHEGVPFTPHQEILTYEELLRLCALLAGQGVSRFKVTGGEALCRKGAVGFIKNLADLPGVVQVTLTSNGSLLAPHLEELSASLRTLTFSLDAFEQQAFERICNTSQSLAEIFAVMEQAAGLGLRVKINTVPLRDYNDSQLESLAAYALERNYQIRFIELMPVGRGKNLIGVPQAEVFARMERAFGKLEPLNEKTGNGPASVYRTFNGGQIGFIAALSERFCASCNRVRVVSTGFLKTCLCHEAGTDLRAPLRGGASDRELLDIIGAAVRDKPRGHNFSFAPSGPADPAGPTDLPNGGAFNMHSVGG